MEEQLMRWRRRAMLYLAGVMLPLCVGNLISHGPNLVRLILIKGTWGVLLSSVALAFPVASPHRRRGLLGFVVFVSAASLAMLAFVRGEEFGSSLVLLMVVPFCLLLLTRDDVAAAVVGSVTSFAGAAAILWVSGGTGVAEVRWLLIIAASGAAAVYAATRQRVRVNAEFGQNTARLEALEKLAASEKARAQAERMALVGQLAAGVAHEINNPLAFISSKLTFIADELPPDASELQLVIEETRAGLKRIAAIVGDLTAFSRGGVEETTVVDLRTIVDEAQRMASLRTRGRVEVLNQLSTDVPMVIGNARHLCQVFLNLILNAADELASAGIPNGKIWLQAESRASELWVDVDDNGPGIPDAVLPSLFTPFFTTKPIGKGTGLGLATSREYLRRAGGDLRASDRPGGGARFTLAMPLAPTAA